MHPAVSQTFVAICPAVPHPAMKRRIRPISESLDRRRGGAEVTTDLVQSFTQAGHPVARSSAVPATVHRPWIPRSCRPRFAVGPYAINRPRHSAPLGRDERHRLFDAAFGHPGSDPLFFTGGPSLIAPASQAERASFDPGLQQRFYRLGNRLNFQRQQRMAAQEKLSARQTRLRFLTLSAAARNQIH